MSAAVDHLENPHDDDQRTHVLIRRLIAAELDFSVVIDFDIAGVDGVDRAERGQAAPGVESEDTCDDDRGEVDAAEETGAAGTEAASVEAPGASAQEQVVDGHDEDGDAAEAVHDRPSAAL